MDKYEVIVRNKSIGHRWSMTFLADDFAHAEEQAKNFTDEQVDDEEIIQIIKEHKGGD